jgi:hypothetical protein
VQRLRRRAAKQSSEGNDYILAELDRIHARLAEAGKESPVIEDIACDLGRLLAKIER